MPDGKLATICTMVMIFSCVISIKLYIDDDVEDDIIDKVKEANKISDANHDKTKEIKKGIIKWFQPCMVEVPVVCSLIQAASLYIFMNAKPKSDGRPNFKMFVVVGIFMSIAMTTTLFTLAKSLCDITADIEKVGGHRYNMIWPPFVAFVTTGAHCYVYYNLFQTVSSKNIDHTLEYTMAAAEQEQCKRFPMERIRSLGETSGGDRTAAMPLAGQTSTKPNMQSGNGNWSP